MYRLSGRFIRRISDKRIEWLTIFENYSDAYLNFVFPYLKLDTDLMMSDQGLSYILWKLYLRLLLSSSSYCILGESRK